MRLALDHHYPIAISEQLQRKGHDAVTALERGWQAEPDESLLTLCLGGQRALVTNNVSDFMTLARQWATMGQQHAGLIFTSDATLPRTHAMIGRYVRLLDALCRANPCNDALLDRVHWLAESAGR
ncbi:MAG TPA: DUF5615 family PIN-like protein [Jatrophihabitantaceae bacterium]